VDSDLKRKLMGTILLPTEGRKLELKRSDFPKRKLFLRLALVAILIIVWGLVHVIS
jgi:hypothetical protein